MRAQRRAPWRLAVAAGDAAGVDYQLPPAPPPPDEPPPKPPKVLLLLAAGADVVAFAALAVTRVRPRAAIVAAVRVAAVSALRTGTCLPSVEGRRTL